MIGVINDTCHMQRASVQVRKILHGRCINSQKMLRFLDKVLMTKWTIVLLYGGYKVLLGITLL